jgi:hypothetical protein
LLFRGELCRGHCRRAALFIDGGLSDQAHGDGGGHARQVIHQAPLPIGRALPRRCLGVQVLQRALGVERRLFEGPQPLVHAPRQVRQLPHAVEHGAADAKIGEGSEGHASLRIEAPSCLQQPRLAITHEIIELGCAPEGAPQTISNLLDRRQRVIEARQHLR